MLTADPTQRMTLDQIKNHKWTNIEHAFPPPSHIPKRLTAAELPNSLEQPVLNEMESFGFDLAAVILQIDEQKSGPAVSIYYLLKEYLDRIAELEKSVPTNGNTLHLRPKLSSTASRPNSFIATNHMLSIVNAANSNGRAKIPFTSYEQGSNGTTNSVGSTVEALRGSQGKTSSGLGTNSSLIAHIPAFKHTGEAADVVPDLQLAVPPLRLRARTVTSDGGKARIARRMTVNGDEAFKTSPLSDAKLAIVIDTPVEVSLPKPQLRPARATIDPFRRRTIAGDPSETEQQKEQPAPTTIPVTSPKKKSGFSSLISSAINKVHRPSSIVAKAEKKVHPRFSTNPTYFGAETTSMKPLVDLKAEIDKTIKKLLASGYFSESTWADYVANIVVEKLDVTFQLEICAIEKTKLYGIEFKRMKGLIPDFQAASRELIANWAI